MTAAPARLEVDELHGRASREQLLAIVEALRERGIAAVPFKGPALAEMLHGDPGARAYRDLDFLVRHTDATTALAALAELGYERRVKLPPNTERAMDAYSGQEILFSKKEGALPIEPHWALVPSTFPVALDYAALWARLRPINLGGRKVLALAPEDLAIALCIHGSKEQWARLQWICDLEALTLAEPKIDWALVLERARHQGCRRLVLVGFSLAQRLLGTLLAPELEAGISEDVVVGRLALQCAKDLVSGKAVPSIYTLSRVRLQIRERVRDKLGYIAGTLLTPRETHFRMVRLPTQLFFLYYIVKLAHDYALLPLWLSFKWTRTWRARA